MTAQGIEDGNILQRISSKYRYLAPALRQIADLILGDPEECQTMTITQLAAAAGVAESSVSRFVREFGLVGYQDLRLRVAEAVFQSRSKGGEAGDQQVVYEGITRDDDIATIIAKIERSSQHAVRQTAARVDVDALTRAVDLIDRADSVIFCCMGSSAIAAENGVMRFMRAGKKCIFFRDQSGQIMAATNATERDVVIGISDSGHTTVVAQVLRLASEHGAATIALTSNENSPVCAHADVVLYTSSSAIGGGLYGESVTSKWGQILIVDMLYAAFAARNADAALAHLEETYTAAIQHTRS
ncbi:RpiR family transcriptional regulator [Actinomadura rubrobrunea]|uniref:RpiR family transcriptional regulator n=1 Tax=Actinomadura rubrobrunea TaxID=115335 RepID=A0A9W6UTM0_9ACTN|nr:MurR/RpiR family transcriptional regulator [Actinomadura rubrobrunea]GLW61908.1 RpiR family transcriptional regulator [Actinomadura rubrobrunea]